MNLKHCFLGSCFLFAFATSWSQAPDDIVGVAQVIRENYFDSARGKEIADELMRRAKDEKLDTLTDRKDLARRLTAMLRPIDGHFNVMYEPQATNEKATDFTMQFMEMARASNYGFRRVDKLEDDVVVIGLSLVPVIDFSDTDDPARRAADDALAKTVGAKAVIFDLRNNGGGDTTMVGYLVSAFVKPGADVYNSFHERTKSSDERPAIEYPTPNTDVPLYILTNRRTGSAAESIAFTLQSAGRAKVIGERSGGAANPGDVFSTPQGFSVFVSTGTPRNPINGRNWEKIGVVPDIETPAEAALERALKLARE